MDEMADIFTSQKFPHILQLTACTILYKSNVGNLKNQYTGSAFIVHSEKKKKTNPNIILGLMCLGVVSYFPGTEGINYRNSGCSNGISSLVFPLWSASCCQWACRGCSWANPGRTQFLGAVKAIAELRQSLLQPQSLLCIPAMRRYMHHYRSCLYLCEVIEFYWEI